MSERSPQSLRLLIILLAVASLGTTALVVLSVARSRMADDAGLQGGIIQSPGREAVPVLVTLPPFALTERSGETVTRDDLLGKVWIADFMFTTCPGPCPMMTSRMAELQSALSQWPGWEQMRLVSVSVDPERDTPEKLREYAGWSKADPEQWLFLTGTREAIWTLVSEGFKLAVAEAEAPDAESPIIHSQKFVLVDRQGRVRGYYDALEEAGRSELLADLATVMAEGPEVSHHE